MRVIKYQTKLNDERKTILVKEQATNYPKISALEQADDVYKLLVDLFQADRLAEEYCWLLAVDAKGHLIGVFEVSHGAGNYSVLRPREIFVWLCLCGATGFMIAHNHPSGDVTPSKDDITTTEAIKKASELMNIVFYDHLIIGDGCYSMNANGLI